MTASPLHVMIIGAGLVGICTADALIRRGARVTLVETGRPMGGASFANSGMIHPSQAFAWVGAANPPEVDAATRALAMRSRDILQDRMEELGLSGMRARSPGCYQLHDSDPARNEAVKRADRLGVKVEKVSAGHLPIERPALYYPDDRSGDARLFGETLLADLLRKGVTLIRCKDATLIERSNRFGIAVSIDGDLRVPDRIIVAAGAKSAAVLSEIGVECGVKPVRGWALDYEKPDRLSLPEAPIMDASTNSAFTIFENRIRLSGTLGEESSEKLEKRWADLWPELTNELGKPLLVWSAERPVSISGKVIVRETALPNVWIHAGHGHMGWTMCAGTAEAIAYDITGITEDVRECREMQKKS